ncbi:MAG: 16S rRNA (adenine(1518)-N(6)/adenine(1519)-N(6))-dimethyltransferase RsmA [Erysipelotrichaceae bacterium]|nr:16S rRNA (adenine(1518)-N(6)/adenine(1519)-N(6))-dimethyltransferase RsmA [Erysipelotrichaceae bacterium]
MNKPIATIARTNEICEKFGLFAKKGYGQNFIIEPGIVEKIAEKGNVTGNCVIEIGPGIGALTESLAKRAAHVCAYEVDARLPEVLAYSLAEYDNVEIILQDFLTCDLEGKVAELKKKYGKVVVCANLPYYITTPILFRIFESKADIESITVMVQKEVADRFAAVPRTKDYNALSVIVQYLYDVKMVMKIPRTIFNPKPNVDSAVIQFNQKERIPLKDQNAFFELVKGCFRQRRKTIYNNLRAYLNDGEKATAALEKCGIAPNARSEELSLEQFISLYEGVESL